MKKIVFKDEEDFHIWQCKILQGLDDFGKQSVSVMAFPIEYPCLMVWDILEEQCIDIDIRHVNQTKDVLDYKYIYIGDFPVKKIKQGTYVYQIFQTSDGCADC